MKEIIKIEHLYKDYLMGGGSLIQNVLKDISLVVNSGDFLSIMGKSGSGKSTLMNILGCLDRPTSGSYYLNGKDVAKLDKDELAGIRNKYIGFVFQSFNLLPRRTVFDNVSMPMIYANHSYRERREKAEEILKTVGLENFMEYYPTQLSGGMQQRTDIARALINNPTVVFADEPTGNLDLKTSIEIMEIFSELNEKMSINIVMVTHEPEIAKYSKRLVYISDGTKEHDFSIAEAVAAGIL
ncbi:MAG: ABC transporter ATP-binding protein [Rickettsiales bacterium]|jgi:putative ABC transport system ATP-binding protein|nr:ABC transporter ATP-binding protein [Rickettsiales bacterium]